MLNNFVKLIITLVSRGMQSHDIVIIDKISIS
ncbi:nucleoside-triphosphatase THEP1 [Staphylococcus epidermidis]